MLFKNKEPQKSISINLNQVPDTKDAFSLIKKIENDFTKQLTELKKNILRRIIALEEEKNSDDLKREIPFNSNNDFKEEFNHDVSKIYDKIDEIVSNFNTLLDDNTKDLEKKKEELSNLNKEELKKINLDIKEQVAKDIISKNSTIEELKIETKNQFSKLELLIEEKFAKTNSEFNSEFVMKKDEIKEFLTNLDLKISNDLNKITDDYTKKQKLFESHLEAQNDELHLIKKEAKNLDHAFDLCYEDLKFKIEERNSELVDEFFKKQEKVKDKIFNEIRTQLENKFETNFDNLKLTEEKINSKEEEFMQKLDFFEETQLNFINTAKKKEDEIENFMNLKSEELDEKQLKLENNVNKIGSNVKEEIDNSLKEIQSKSNDVIKKIEKIDFDFDKKVKELFSNMKNEINEQEKNIEIKKKDLINSIEKKEIHFSKLFSELKIDSQSNLKSFKEIISKEIADLVGEIENVLKKNILKVDERVKLFENYGEKLNAGLLDLTAVKRKLEVDIELLRKELDVLKNKSRINNSSNEEIVIENNTNISTIVNSISSYEKQLFDTIKNLKSKNISEEDIKTQLIKKGHPMFYISMVLENMPFFE